MNYVFVFDGLQVGGIERVGVDYINLLSDRGHKVTVLNVKPGYDALYHELPEACKTYEIRLSRKIVPYRYAKAIEKGIYGAVLYAIISFTLGILNHIHHIGSAHRLRELKNTDVVIAFSGHFNDLMLVASGYVPGKKIAWLHGSEFEYKVVSDGYFALYRKIKNLVCLSEFCDITCKQFNVENGINKVLIYNPVLIQKKRIDNDKVENLRRRYGRYVLMVGRLSPDKDQKTLIQAIIRINRERKDKIQLLLAGDGMNRELLEKFVDDNKAKEFVHFLGNCFDVQNYYAAAHIYAHSSPMEGLPTVLLEAMTYGVPIAATDSIPGVREILGNNECGLISPVGNWESLGENIMRLYEDNELREKMISLGRERVKAFNPDIVIKRLEKFIMSI